jgi:hypothetical protein
MNKTKNLQIRLHPATYKKLEKIILKGALENNNTKNISTFVRDEMIEPFISASELSGRPIKFEDMKNYLKSHIPEINKMISGNK